MGSRAREGAQLRDRSTEQIRKTPIPPQTAEQCVSIQAAPKEACKAVFLPYDTRF